MTNLHLFLVQTTAVVPQVQYVAQQPGQQVIMMTPQQMPQPGLYFLSYWSFS